MTCAVAEGGSLIFGDVLGNVFISDRSTQLCDKKHKLFRGEVKGMLSLLFITRDSNLPFQYKMRVMIEARGWVEWSG